MHFLSPKVMQASGLIGLAAAAIFWAITDRIEPVLVTIAGSLVGIGKYTGAVHDLDTEPAPAPAGIPAPADKPTTP